MEEGQGRSKAQCLLKNSDYSCVHGWCGRYSVFSSVFSFDLIINLVGKIVSVPFQSRFLFCELKNVADSFFPSEINVGMYVVAASQAAIVAL